MRGNRGLVVIALVLIILAALAGGAYIYMQGGGGLMGAQAEPEPTVETPPVETTDIVVAMQSIPRGMEISVEQQAIDLQPWPNDSLPVAYYTSTEDVDLKFARMDIPRGMPVLPDMVAEPGGMLSVSGSAAALFEPEDRVAYAIPMDTQGSVAWAIKPGDRVDVLAAINIKNTEFASEGIKEFTYLEEPELPGQTSPYGRFELLPNGRWAAIYNISTEQTVDPALIVQMTVQDAIVWHVGVWEDEVETTDTMTTQTSADATGGAPLGGAAQEPPPTPVPLQEERDIEPITLLVTREDALMLKYLHEIGADLDLALRPAGVTGTMLQTQPVWFRFVLDKYQLPTEMPDDPIGPTPLHPPLEVLPQATPTPEE